MRRRSAEHEGSAPGASGKKRLPSGGRAKAGKRRRREQERRGIGRLQRGSRRNTDRSSAGAVRDTDGHPFRAGEHGTNKRQSCQDPGQAGSSSTYAVYSLPDADAGSARNAYARRPAKRQRSSRVKRTHARPVRQHSAGTGKHPCSNASSSRHHDKAGRDTARPAPHPRPPPRNQSRVRRRSLSRRRPLSRLQRQTALLPRRKPRNRLLRPTRRAAHRSLPPRRQMRRKRRPGCPPEPHLSPSWIRSAA